MSLKVRDCTRIAVAVALGYIAYRGVWSFLRNEITISVTELVQLPPSERLLELDEQTPLQGEIRCETYLMRSYRFLMRLSANVKGVSTSPPATSHSRHRVIHATENTSYRTMMSHGISKKREGLPNVTVHDVHSMVDYWELSPNGNVCFTPPCIGDELLMCYEASAKAGHPVNAVVKNCYLQADERPGLKRLSFDFMVYDIVHAAKIRIALPNRYCDVVTIHTGGVGLVQQPDARKPHHFIWDIGNVDETTWKKVKSLAPDVLPEGRLARRGFTDDDLAVAVERRKSGENSEVMANSYQLPNTMDTKLESRSERCDGDTPVDTDAKRGMLGTHTSSGLPEGTQLLIAHFLIVFEEPDGMEYDYVSTDSELSEGENEGGECDEARRRTGDTRSSRATVSTGRKAAKRESRAPKSKMVRYSADSLLTLGRGVSTSVPAVELSYSVGGLVSGVTVRKLQTVSDLPNWIPRSMLDRWLLRWMVPGIHQLRLGKYAQYNSWFVQPISVTSL
ncbi:hypothetical protein TraAM80_00776 [Trypanosoma rangeli]|uniref:Uncharacterized protein n=1 Tax=Trypanosoma rangeli TaxID=5698 RepID=A0A422P1T0_TRYRA|nr:uncharacterized protein TraAM80_00776 [Trypanosoma rangeli]RNF11692.1 hypothetical protein TraAM80_00776 [Trypanosoma rangeli]|eukprot:RNF11692.1 hypothetical protein TraAM80_00776 [Trypanosoma rangeli]